MMSEGGGNGQYDNLRTKDGSTKNVVETSHEKCQIYSDLHNILYDQF